jgi:hypothetical protein
MIIFPTRKEKIKELIPPRKGNPTTPSINHARSKFVVWRWSPGQKKDLIPSPPPEDRRFRMAQTVQNENWTPKSQKNPVMFARRLTFFDPFEYRSPHNMSPCSRTTRFSGHPDPKIRPYAWRGCIPFPDVCHAHDQVF